MSSIGQDELSSLTDQQLRSRLLQYGLANMPITDTTRKVLVGKLRKAIEGEKSAPRRETMHVTKFPTDEEKVAAKPGPASRKNTNRRNTINATPMTSDDIVPLVKPKNMRRSGRITPTFNENGNSIAPIAVQPLENDIIELDEDTPTPETYLPPKRTSRSPSLGKSQTVVTSYKTEISKPIAIVESNEEDDEGDDDEEDESSGGNGQYKIYPSLPTNGFKNLSPTKTSRQSTLRRTTTHTTAYEPTSSYKPLFEDNYVPFKTPLTKPVVPTYSATSSSSVNRRHTTSSYNSKYDDDSATEHSDIDAPYLSDFAKRLSQLRPEPLDRKIIADVKQQNHIGNDSLWLSFSNLVAAFARKFGTIILAGGLLMIVVFIYVFFIMP